MQVVNSQFILKFKGISAGVPAGELVGVPFAAVEGLVDVTVEVD